MALEAEGVGLLFLVIGNIQLIRIRPVQEFLVGRAVGIVAGDAFPLLDRAVERPLTLQ